MSPNGTFVLNTLTHIVLFFVTLALFVLLEIRLSQKTSRSCNGTVAPRIPFRPFRKLRKYVAILIFYSCLSSASPLAEGLSRREKNVSEEGATDGGLARYIKLSA